MTAATITPVYGGLRGRGIVMAIANNQATAIRVELPHPRDSIAIQKNGHATLPSWLPITWEHTVASIPSGASVVAAIRLHPYWMALSGNCFVRCRLVVSDGHKARECETVGKVPLLIPDSSTIRREVSELAKQGRAFAECESMVVDANGENLETVCRRRASELLCLREASSLDISPERFNS